MPLKPGSSRAVIGANIAELERSGYPPKQAEAIAFNKAGLQRHKRNEPKKKPRKKKK